MLVVWLRTYITGILYTLSTSEHSDAAGPCCIQSNVILSFHEKSSHLATCVFAWALQGSVITHWKANVIVHEIYSITFFLHQEKDLRRPQFQRMNLWDNILMRYYRIGYISCYIPPTFTATPAPLSWMIMCIRICIIISEAYLFRWSRRGGSETP